VAENLKRLLKPGTGTILVRDYAAGDLAEQRLADHARPKFLGSEHFYVRGDGTRCLYFTEARSPAPCLSLKLPCKASIELSAEARTSVARMHCQMQVKQMPAM
jgi:hypothetical protein